MKPLIKLTSLILLGNIFLFSCDNNNSSNNSENSNPDSEATNSMTINGNEFKITTAILRYKGAGSQAGDHDFSITLSEGTSPQDEKAFAYFDLSTSSPDSVVSGNYVIDRNNDEVGFVSFNEFSEVNVLDSILTSGTLEITSNSATDYTLNFSSGNFEVSWSGEMIRDDSN